MSTGNIVKSYYQFNDYEETTAKKTSVKGGGDVEIYL